MIRSRASRREERALWDGFVHRAPYDPLTIVTPRLMDAPEGRVNPLVSEVHSPEVMSEHLQVLGRSLGADLVVVVPLDDVANRKVQETFGSDPRTYAHAVVAAVRANYDVDAAPGLGGQFPLIKAQMLDFVLASYIRELGYPATVHYFPNQAAARTLLGTLSSTSDDALKRLRPYAVVAGILLTDLPLAKSG
jgi:hypothetical protein